VAAQRVMRRVRLASMDFIYHAVRFELSCRTGPLRVARSLRDLYTSCLIGDGFGPPVGRGEGVFRW